MRHATGGRARRWVALVESNVWCGTAAGSLATISMTPPKTPRSLPALIFMSRWLQLPL
jgi:hypothetical protein